MTKNNLSVKYPELVKEWNYDKNNGCSPSDFTYGSNKKVWWKCPSGHDYQMRIANRTKQNQNCPVCNGKQVLAGFNDLKSQYPDIASQWDYQKNEKGPEQYTAHSNKKVFWICKHNHSYLATIGERTGKEGHTTGCPFCAGRKALQGFNDLTTVRPELVTEWDYDANKDLLPTSVTEFSMKSVHWICKNGHKWTAPVASRSSGNGCPVCSNKQLLKGYNDLSTLFPHIAAEWDYDKNATRPDEHIAGTHTKVWWKCLNCDNSWYASIKERTYGKTGCPHCAFYHKTSFPEQSILFYIKKHFVNAINSYKPDYLAPYEVDILIPELKLGIEYDGKFWHENTNRDLTKSQKLAEQGIKLIRIRENGLPDAPIGDIVIECPTYKGDLTELTCTLKKLFQKLQEIYNVSFKTDVDVERDFLEIKSSYEGTKKAKSLLYANPSILQEWNHQKNEKLTPDKVTPHSHSIVWWKCSRCGKEWQQSIKTKVLGGLLCESCSKSDANIKRMKESAINKNTKTVSEYPLLIEEWDFETNKNLNPKYVTYGSERKVTWICKTCGNHFLMPVKARTKGQGCPLCGRKKICYDKKQKSKHMQ